MVNGFTIFGVKIYFYAIIIIIGAIAGAFLAAHEAKRKGLSADIVWDVLPWLLIAGIIGARIWHVLTPSESMLIDGKNPYFIYPLDILKDPRRRFGYTRWCNCRGGCTLDIYK